MSQVLTRVVREYLVREESGETLVKTQTRHHLLETSRQGPPGPPGEPGPAGGASVQRIAGETVSALRAVYEINNVVWPLDYRDEDNIFNLLGVTLTSADASGFVNVQRSGVLTDSSWNWSLGRVYLGASGTLTQVAPSDGFSVLIGTAVSPTRLILNLQDPIELE